MIPRRIKTLGSCIQRQEYNKRNFVAMNKR